MGESTISEDGANPFARIFNTVDKTEYMDGCVRGNTAGTYMHGIFDGQEFCDSLINMLSVPRMLCICILCTIKGVLILQNNTPLLNIIHFIQFSFNL